ncbi:MAG TPA: response regulator [Hanamia sp.]|nr:response regulator [Hanamia sp.]
MRSTVKKNLRLGLGLSLALLFISSFASYISIKNLIEGTQMVRNSNQILDNLNSILSVTRDAETGQRGFLLTGNTAFLGPYNDAKGKSDILFEELEKQAANEDLDRKKLAQLKLDVVNRMAILEQNLNHKKNNQPVSAEDLLSGKKYMEDLRETIAIMRNEETRQLESRLMNVKRLANVTPPLIILAAFLAIGITLFFYRKVSSDFNEKNKLQGELEQKNREIEDKISAIENVASQISKGHYKMRLDSITKDNLGSLMISLNSMAASLQHSFNLLQDKEWMQSGIANLNDKMVGEKSIPVLATDILESIVEHTNSQLAAIYLLGDDNLLRLEGSYALAPDENKKVLQVGEGICGQALRSGSMIFLENIPDNEATITYASGKTKPRALVAAPIFRDKNPIGVLELASLESYTPLELDFVKNVSNNIGIAFYGAQNRKKLQDLLEETQAQAEELQTQHSELENMNAELEAQTQKVQASEEELRVQQEELLQSNQELEERTGLLEEKNTLIEERNADILQKSKELELSTKYKSEFLANMSHELRTPLNSILLLSKLMSDNTELDKEYIEYAEVIQSSGQGLLSLIDEILDLSKIEAGKMNLEITEVSLKNVAANMQSLFMPVANNKKLSFNIKLDDDVQPVIISDKMRLEQILKNLLSNAIKFTEEGEVSLHISSDITGKKTLFAVKDTGIGIAGDKLNLIFEAFQQADGSTRRKYGGTGLGLSISRQLARLLGGEIELKSTEGTGSLFTLTLPIDINMAIPVQDKPEKILSKFPDQIPEQSKTFTVSFIPNEIEDDRDNITEADKVILIIEDDTAFAKILLDYTRKKNYKGLVAVRGDDGIQMAKHYKPLAIMLDIQLPVVDGWQVMEELKTNSETKPIPVHIMSSLEVKKESMLKGAVDFINKPFALEQIQKIFQKLEYALSRHPKKVLIVEENKQHAKALTYFLSANNINTQIATNVSESIEALLKHEIDCVILDMGIPDRNAYETLETIKTAEGLENLPIIVFTGKNLSKGEENRIKKYADSIVVKTAHSYQRILDEAGLFLHLVEEKNKNGHSKMSVSSAVTDLRNVLQNKIVLIADDDVRNIFSLTKALEMHNMKVLSATDGREALNILKETPGVNVVLMDMMMPEMDGYETIREIRSMNGFKGIPVLAVTAKAMMGDREKCIAAGASDYISKPVDVDQLISLLRVWLYDKI